MRRNKLVLLGIALLLISLELGATNSLVKDVVEKPKQEVIKEKIEPVEVVQVNQLVYKGEAAVEAGEYIYFKEGKETDRGAQLVRQNLESGARENISCVRDNFFICEENIYYVSINSLYSIKVDGNQQTLIAKNVKNIVAIKQNFIYYKDINDNLCRIDSEGKKISELVKIGYSGEVAVCNDRIYYTVQKEGAYKLYVMDLEGTNKTLILNKNKLKDLIVEENSLYLVYNDKKSDIEDCIARITADNQVEIITKSTEGIDESISEKGYTGMSLECIENGMIYYMVNSSDPYLSMLCKVTLDGEKSEICSVGDLPRLTSVNSVNGLKVQDDNMCLKISGDDADSQIYTIKTDGSKKRLITTNEEISEFSLVGTKVFFGAYSNEDDIYATFKRR